MNGPERDFSRELYPFLYRDEGDGADRMADAVSEARISTLRKCADVVALRTQLRDEYADELSRAGANMAAAFAAGGTLLAFGNGGSATDASDAAVDCLAPPVAHWRSLPAISLCGDIGFITGVANDVGFESVFARHLGAIAQPGDIALGFTTSGNSPSVVVALGEAKRRGLLAIAITGSEGGEVAAPEVADHCFIARLDYVPRIQEGHATIWHTLLELIHVALGDGPAVAAA